MTRRKHHRISQVLALPRPIVDSNSSPQLPFRCLTMPLAAKELGRRTSMNLSISSSRNR